MVVAMLNGSELAGARCDPTCLGGVLVGPVGLVGARSIAVTAWLAIYFGPIRRNSFDGLTSHECLQLIDGIFVCGPLSVVRALSWLAPIM